MTITPRDSKDLLIVGPGVLGSYAGKLWRAAHPHAKVIAVTNTENNHERLSKMGLQPTVKSSLSAGDRYPYVLFSAPPSGAQDYAKEVAAAMSLWDNSLPNSCFLFTGSMGVCTVDDGSVVTEDCPVGAQGTSPSIDKLLAAEDLVLRAGGNVLRLVGLYHATRGAHTYFLKVQQVPRPGDYVVNLLHYEDAADLSVKILDGSGSGPFRQKIFMGCDGHPVTFRDMMASVMASPRFAGQTPVTFAQPDMGPNRSKRCDNAHTRQLLGGWQPKYSSFASFMTEHKAEDFYTTSGLF